MDVSSLLISAGIPSAIVSALGFFLRRHFKLEDAKRLVRQKEIDANAENQRQQQIAWQEESARKNNEYNLLIIGCLNASLDLGEATAQALINGKANGEVHSAIEASKKARCAQLEYLQKEVVAGLRK